MALRIEDAFESGRVAARIRVERGYDPKAREYVTPKSRAGTRSVPITAELRGYLAAHKLRLGRADGLLFGAAADRPFDPGVVAARARLAWKAARLAPIGLHEARHTFASLMIAAGVNAKALSTMMGHASLTITYDRYGHLMPGAEQESADLLDAYIAAQREKAMAGAKV
jgi:integrase